MLLGAGASVDAGLPTSAQLTDQLLRHPNVGNDPGFNDVAWALNAAVGALVAHRAANRQLASEPIDVESLFSAVQMLAERDNLEVAPFVGSWNSSVVQATSSRPPRPQWGADLVRAIQSPRNHSSDRVGREVQQVLTEVLSYHLRPGDSTRLYRDLEHKMIAALHDLLAVTNEERVNYLGHLFDLADGVQIATLNYDLTVEAAAKIRKVELDRGIERWRGGFDWSWDIDSSIPTLLKLHGSLDWAYRPSGHKSLPLTRVEVANGPGSRRDTAIIFGRREKLRSKGPFLAMLAAFQEWLRETSHLVVIGYSFQDEHINTAFAEWISSRKGALLTIIDPTFPRSQGRSIFPRGPEAPFAPSPRELLAWLAEKQGQSEGSRFFPNQKYQIYREGAAVALNKLARGVDPD